MIICIFICCRALSSSKPSSDPRPFLGDGAGDKSARASNSAWSSARDRMNGEKHDPTKPIHLTHVSELYVSPRHASLSSALRGKQLQLIVNETLSSVLERWPRGQGDSLPRPQFCIAIARKLQQ